MTPDQQQAILDAGLKLAQPQTENVIATIPGGGRVVKAADGSLSFTSPGYATSDPAKVEKIMRGARPADISKAGFYSDAISQHPAAAYVSKFIQGAPFLGEYTDEAAGVMFGNKTRDAMRMMQTGMDKTRPKTSAALQMAGALAFGAPIAAAVAPSLAVSVPGGMVGKVVAAGALGAGLGAAEGGISGYGAGTGKNRGAMASRRAKLGGFVGGSIGVAAPVVSSAIRSTLSRMKRSDVGTISKYLGISPDAARVVKDAVQNEDFTAAKQAIDNAGGSAMLADAGHSTSTLLDASIAGGGKAGNIAHQAVGARISGDSARLVGALDSTLGPPQGIGSIQSSIRQGSSGARDSAYRAAYAAPIDYSSAPGMQIERMLPRIPKSAITTANNLMRAEGQSSRQMLIKVGKDGSLTFKKLPDVRQIDYITRALKDVAAREDGKGKLGGVTNLGRVYSGLASDLRSAAKRAVPEYRAALNVASDAITEKNASDMGRNLLRPGTTREDVALALKGASKAEIKAAQKGLRSYIDDTMANVKATMANPATDAREAAKLIGDMSSRASKEKMSFVLGKKAADTIAKEIDRTASGLNLKARIAANSKTNIRGVVQDRVGQITQPGAVSELLSGKPLEAGRRLLGMMTNHTGESQSAQSRAVFDEIAGALTKVRGEQAKMALSVMEKAIGGQPIKDSEARFLANTLTGAIGSGAFRGMSRPQTIQ